MILTDREIAASLRAGQIIISPPPSAAAYSSTTVDLTLLDKFATWTASPGLHIRPGMAGYKYSQIMHLQASQTANTFELRPGGFVLAWTKEELTIPNSSRLAARVEGKSSISRLGISVHVTAPTIHSGFEGPIQLEMCNFGPHTVILDAGMPICQLVFELTLGTSDKGYGGMFLNQTP